MTVPRPRGDEPTLKITEELDMAKSAYFIIRFGLSDGHLPDYVGSAQKFTSRKELANSIREELINFNLPETLFARANIRAVWQMVQRSGPSSADFDIYHETNVLSYSGLTEAEYQAMQEEGDQ